MAARPAIQVLRTKSAPVAMHRGIHPPAGILARAAATNTASRSTKKPANNAPTTTGHRHNFFAHLRKSNKKTKRKILPIETLETRATSRKTWLHKPPDHIYKKWSSQSDKTKNLLRVGKICRSSENCNQSHNREPKNSIHGRNVDLSQVSFARSHNSHPRKHVQLHALLQNAESSTEKKN